MGDALVTLREELGFGARHSLELRPKADLNDCGKVIVSFLNGQGGVLLCGVDDKGIVKGISKVEQVAHDLEQALKVNIQPPVLFSIEVHPFQNKDIIVIEVPAGKDIPYAYQNDIYVRNSNSIQKADVDTLRDMILRKQIEPERWERQFTDVVEADLSQEACKKLLSSQRLPQNIRETEQGITHQLQMLSLAKYGRITNAGLALLANNPAIQHPQTRVRALCTSHKSADEYRDIQHFEGPLVDVLELLQRFIDRNTPTKARFSNASNVREDFPLYPAKAVREALVNAFAHREYSHFSGGIKVEVRPHELRIWNSGALPEGINLETLQHGNVSILRNPDIAHALYLQGYMEKLGRGSVVICEACEQSGLPPPKWESDSKSGVTLTFFAPEATREVTPEATREVTPEVEKLIKALKKEMKRAEIQEKLALKDDEHFRLAYLVPAMNAGIVEMTIPDKPKSPSQRYRLTQLGKNMVLARKYQ